MLGLLACTLAALVYQNTFDNPFVFDDRDTVLLNRSLIAPWDFGAALLHNLARPVVNLSYAVDRSLWGFTSFGYHLTNVILHVVAVGLFYGWCTRALSDSEGKGKVASESEPSEAAAWGAFFAAAVFALHPVMSAAVGYISGRSELLAAIGMLASLTYARRAIVARNRTAGMLAIVFGALAVGSSSSAAALPLLVLAYDAWVLRDPRWRQRAARIYAPATLAIVIAAGWYLAARPAPVTPPGSALAPLLTGAIVVWRYVGLLVLPRGQALVHDVHWAARAWDLAGLAALVGLAVCTTLAVRVRRTHPLLAFGVIWFLGVLAPASSFFPVRDAMAEHRLYLAYGGLLLAAASLLAGTLTARGAWRAGVAVLLLVMALVTFRRNQMWSDPMALWQEAIVRSPEAWQAHWGYAELLRETGQCGRAAVEYAEVVRLRPDHGAALTEVQGCR